jgi:hypothetical protein
LVLTSMGIKSQAGLVQGTMWADREQAPGE